MKLRQLVYAATLALAALSAGKVYDFQVNSDFRTAELETITLGANPEVRFKNHEYEWITVDRVDDGLLPIASYMLNEDKDQTVDRIYQKRIGSSSWEDVTDRLTGISHGLATERHVNALLRDNGLPNYY